MSVKSKIMKRLPVKDCNVGAEMVVLVHLPRDNLGIILKKCLVSHSQFPNRLYPVFRIIGCARA